MLKISDSQRKQILDRMVSEAMLNDLLGSEQVLTGIERDLEAAPIPLVSIGPSGIGGEYQREF